MHRVAPYRKLWCLVLLPQLLLLQYALAFDAAPRWGQATVVVNDALFIYGGKTDEFNSYSYTSAPNTNDILYLSLSTSFTGASPPWELVSGSSNTSTSQGPALAWHTLSAFNNTGVLLFGGQPDPNSSTVIVDRNDSAALLDVFSRLGPTWISEPSSWGGQPIRRIRHSTATSPDGLVFIFGGEKADGSQNTFPEHYYFDPSSLTFTALPSTGAPPHLYGHVSIILPDGRILVFGGFCQPQGALLSFSTIWSLDSKTRAWSVITVDSASLPSPRMAFAAVLITGGKIIIHGGSDANLQVNFADGWELDTTTFTWTQIDALSQLGPRRDHSAVAYGDLVIFGFGYSNSGPAPAPLQIFDPSSNSFVPSYTPPPATVTPTQTLPVPTQTPKPNTPTSPPHTTNSGVQPTSTLDIPNNNNGSNDDSSSSSTTAIAVGTVFGVLGLIVVGLGTAYYVRRKHRGRERERSFMALGGYDGDDGGGSPHLHERIPIANMTEVDSPTHAHHGLLATLGLAGAATKMRAVRNPNQRRDMLADEDTQSFGEWYNSRRREGTGGSSWSLRSILGAGARLRSREASTTSHGTGNLPTPWREKADPFSDGATLLRDEETGFIGAATVGAGTRPLARRELSYASSKSGRSYRDPFADPIQEERRALKDAVDPYTDQDHSSEEGDDGLDPLRPSIRAVPTLPLLKTVLPLSQQAGHPLSPLSEHTSQSSLPLQTFSTSGSSQAHSSGNISPLPGGSLSRATSLTSMEPTPPPRSPLPKTTSIIGAAMLNTNQPMRRSNSWWARFSRTSLLDRRSSVPSRGGYEIRDPNPPPKLVAIEERSVVSSPTPDKNSPNGKGSPGSAETGKQTKESPQQAALLYRANSGRLFGTGHGKSMTSLRTADSEAIERMAGQMDVVQRTTTRSQRGTGSMSSTGGLSIDTHGSSSEFGEGQMGNEGSRDSQDENLIFLASPVEGAHQSQGVIVDASSHPLALSGTEPAPHPRLSSPPPSAWPVSKARAGSTTPPGSDSNSPLSPSNVAARVRAYERRMSQEQPISLPPTNTKVREERTKKLQVDYGLVPRPNLFVANPDHRSSTYSAESS